MTDEEVKALTKMEKMQIAQEKLQIKNDIFKLPMLMSTVALQAASFSEVEQLKMKRMTGEAPELTAHLQRMVKCMQLA